jgi:hypothetical protein
MFYSELYVQSGITARETLDFRPILIYPQSEDGAFIILINYVGQREHK